MEKTRLERAATVLFCIIAAVIIIYVLFEYAFGIILPFAVAFLVGVPIYHLSARISRCTHLPRKLCSTLLVILFLGNICLIVFFVFNRLFAELEGLVEWLKSDGERVRSALGDVFGYVENISSRIPFIEEIESVEGLEGLRERIDSGVSELISDIINKLTSSLPRWAVRVIKYTPKAFITVIVTLIASFYFAADYGKLRDAVISSLPARSGERVSRVLGAVGNALKCYVRAYLFIMLLTFFEVFCGLLIMGKRYALLLAVVIALVDILPVLGAGTVIVPWAVFSLMSGDMRTGLGLLVLYGVVTIIRQVLEPKIVGGGLGIHPLLTLFAMFSGLTLFGVTGMLLAPSMVMIAREIFKAD